MNRVVGRFAEYRRQKRKALMPFITAGDPDLATTAALLAELPRRGADLIELGIPYSDPIADGPVIAASYTRALQKGVTLDGIFAAVRDWRASDPETPLVAMVSYAIIYRRGVESFLDAAQRAGFDGLIVPDLPLDEAEHLAGPIQARGLVLAPLITPTTPPDRAAAIARSATGFVYYVSVAGITGVRRELPPELAGNVASLRQQTDLPIGIGFGISNKDQVRAVAALADGVIVGSALVNKIAEAARDPVAAAGDFVGELAAGLGC